MKPSTILISPCFRAS